MPEALVQVGMRIPADISPELAEVIGVHLGDGFMVRYEAKGQSVSQVGFTGNMSEFPYYENFIRPTFESAFGVVGRLFLRKLDHTTRYVVYSRELVQYLVTLGLPLGKKHDAAIPPFLLERGLVIPCIRGFYHAEGSIYRRYSKAYKGHHKVYDNLLTLQVRAKLKTVMSQVTEELSRLQIVCNRLTANDGVYTLRITRQSEIAKFFKVIQPRLKVLPRPKNPLIAGQGRLGMRACGSARLEQLALS